MIHNFETLKDGKTKLATHKRLSITSWHRPLVYFSNFAPYFSALTINKLKSLQHTFPLEKMLGFTLQLLLESL